jgi:hypothetical protein
MKWQIKLATPNWQLRSSCNKFIKERVCAVWIQVESLIFEKSDDSPMIEVVMSNQNSNFNQ